MDWESGMLFFWKNSRKTFGLGMQGEFSGLLIGRNRLGVVYDLSETTPLDELRGGQPI